MTATLRSAPTDNRPGVVGTRTRSAWLAFAIFAAPLIFTIGQSLLPVLPDDLDSAFPGMIEHRDALFASQLLTAAGAFLFVPAVVAIWSLVPRAARGAGLLLVGGIVLAVGTWSNGLSEAVLGYVGRAATSSAVPPDAGASVLRALDLDVLGLAGLPISFLPIPIFALGLLLTAVALIVSRSVPIWQPIAIIVGTLASFAFAGMGPIALLTGLPLIIGFWSMGILLVSRRREPLTAGKGSDALNL